MIETEASKVLEETDRERGEKNFRLSQPYPTDHIYCSASPDIS